MQIREIEFSKMEGCGNSFVVTADMHCSGIDWQALSRRLCDPHYGVGSDGLMVVKPSTRADFEICMVNPDGSLMGMCGNGIRCVSRYVGLYGLAPAATTSLRFEVEGRLLKCRLLPEGNLIKVDLAEPAFAPESLPIEWEEEFINQKLDAGDEEFKATAVSMGNPHCVIFVEDVEIVDLSRVGPLIENHRLFPKRTNVEFVQRIARDHLKVRVWERGAGITLACGTGACASVAAGARNGFCEPCCRVELPGGDLRVEWDRRSNRVFLTGPAREICRAKLTGEF